MGELMKMDDIQNINNKSRFTTNSEKSTTLLLAMLTQVTNNFLECEPSQKNLEELYSYVNMAQTLSTTIKYLESNELIHNHMDFTSSDNEFDY